jgi:hypothetical protein
VSLCATCAARAACVVCVACVLAAAGCSAVEPALRGGPSPVAESPLAAFDGAQFEWVESRCVDGPLPLERAGFERRLDTELQGVGAAQTLRFTYDSAWIVPGCASTEVWSLSPLPGGLWQYEPEAVVAVPASVTCGAAAVAERGVLRRTGDVLQEVRFASRWCRGYDAMFTYRRVPARPPDDASLLRRWFAHWTRRDAAAAAALWVESAVLVEPFLRTADGAPARHEGRALVQAWLEHAFASVAWLAVAPSEPPYAVAPGRYVAPFHYMDPDLAAPLSGRYLVVIAEHEIYSVEIQLLESPSAIAADPASAPKP